MITSPHIQSISQHDANRQSASILSSFVSWRRCDILRGGTSTFLRQNAGEAYVPKPSTISKQSGDAENQQNNDQIPQKKRRGRRGGKKVQAARQRAMARPINASIEEELRTLAFQLAEIKSAGDAGTSGHISLHSIKFPFVLTMPMFGNGYHMTGLHGQPNALFSAFVQVQRNLPKAAMQ